MQDWLTSNDIKHIIKQNHIFNNVTLASKLRVIKAFSKSDMAIIWINIWDAQSGARAKDLINRCFNVRKYIATIRGANTNPGIPQCKNCWRWGYSMFSCRIQGSKCIKCNGPYKSENHHKFGWCCKANKKTNLPCLETKKSKPYPHSFKYSNCQGTIKQTQIHVCFGRTALIESGIWRNILRSMKTELSQFVWLQMGNPNHDI